MFKKFLALAVIASFGAAALADELKVVVSVENGSKTTEVVGADIYANLNGKLTEITVAPDEMPFKMNAKFGALRLKSFWVTRKQLENATEEKAE